MLAVGLLRNTYGGGGVSIDASLLRALPAVFGYAQGSQIVGERQFRRLVSQGQIERLARGVYRQAGQLGDEELIEITRRAPRATLCLRTALSRHDLTDEIPGEWDVAIPRGAWAPLTQTRVRWRHFDPVTFEIGREIIELEGGIEIGQYRAERSIVDAFRMRHREGADLAVEALKRWLRLGGQPSVLLQVAKSFPQALPSLRQALEILL